MKAGFAAVCITPPVGKDIPGLFERRVAIGVNDDLFARAAVVDDGKQAVALVQTDAIALPGAVVRDARAMAQRLCGIEGENCLVAATHTHSGGPTFGGFLSEPDPDYCRFLAEQIATAISEAYRLRRPALVGTGTAQAAGVAFNRRFEMKDGAQRTHPGKMNPDIVGPSGPEDASVTVVGFCDPETFRPFGCLVNFACHATHMNGVLYSADYVRWVVQTLCAEYGHDFGVTFLNGACGDVTQVDNRNPRPGEFGPYWCERTGRVVGSGALQALGRMDYFGKATVSRDCAKVRVEMRECPPEACRAARALLRKRYVTAEDVETIYANELLKVDALCRAVPFRRLEIVGVRIADTVFWGVPAEFFQQFALDVRKSSPFRHTCCVELANGYEGYICTKAAFSGGGYEVRTARSSYLEPDAGSKVVTGAKRLVKKMAEDASRELAALPGRCAWPVVRDTALDGIQQINKKS